MQLCVLTVDERVLADEGTDIDAIDHDTNGKGTETTGNDKNGKVVNLFI